MTPNFQSQKREFYHVLRVMNKPCLLTMEDNKNISSISNNTNKNNLGSSCGVTAIEVGNRHRVPNSNPIRDCLHFKLRL